jgi:TonB family protein
MKKIILAISIFAVMQAQAQTTPKPEEPPQAKVILRENVRSVDNTLIMESEPEPDPDRLPSKIENDDQVYIFVEQDVTFQGGGKDAAAKWVNANLIYPAIARENGLQGKVFITFVVNTQGKVQDITVAKDNVGGGCAEEAMRVIRSMPDWQPGKQKGQPVKVKVTLPFSFKLENPKPEELKH